MGMRPKSRGHTYCWRKAANSRPGPHDYSGSQRCFSRAAAVRRTEQGRVRPAYPSTAADSEADFRWQRARVAADSPNLHRVREILARKLSGPRHHVVRRLPVAMPEHLQHSGVGVWRRQNPLPGHGLQPPPHLAAKRESGFRTGVEHRFGCFFRLPSHRGIFLAVQSLIANVAKLHEPR